VPEGHVQAGHGTLHDRPGHGGRPAGFPCRTARRFARRRVDCPAAAAVEVAAGTPAASWSDSRPLKIVPKGLRSFDAHGRRVLLELLPGARTGTGCPRVSVSGRPALRKPDRAGIFGRFDLWPLGLRQIVAGQGGPIARLAEHVISVYVEATTDETEARLLNTLRKRCPGLPSTWT